jgi:hypothetical protein
MQIPRQITLKISKSISRKQGQKGGNANPTHLHIVRRKFSASGALIDTHVLYPEAAGEVAVSQRVNLIDMQLLTQALINSLGDEASKKMVLWIPN